MDPAAISRDKLVAAALSFAATRAHNEIEEDRGYHDAQAELQTELLDEAARDYLEARGWLVR